MPKKNGRTILHTAIYPTTGYKMYPKNCSASGKKKGGGHHVVKAFCLLGFTTLSRSLFFQIFVCSTLVNLLNCKHRIGFYASWADGSLATFLCLVLE